MTTTKEFRDVLKRLTDEQVLKLAKARVASEAFLLDTSAHATVVRAVFPLTFAMYLSDEERSDIMREAEGMVNMSEETVE